MKNETGRVEKTAAEKNPSDSTRSRLIRAAGEAFAEHGFRGANLRDICAAAPANLGAVRYYFGGKMGLYREVIFDALREVLADDADQLRHASDDPAADLRRWVQVFLRVVLYRRSRHPYLSRVFAMELAHPTGVIDDIVPKILAPARNSLRAIIARITGKGATTKLVTERANMIAFLCLQFELLRPVLERLGPAIPSTPESVAALADRIADFALDGLRPKS